MRRVILWIVAISITFALGIGADSLERYLLTKKPAAVAKVEKVEFVAPVFATPAVAPLPAPEQTPAPKLIVDYNMEKFDRYGALYIMGPAPEGFRDFDYIELGLTGTHSVEGSEYITVYSANYSEWAPANFGLVTERYLYFTTEPTRESGFQYRFEGEFLIKNFSAVEGKNKAVVRGTLTKSKNGRTLAEQTITFRVDHMGC